MKYTSVFLTLLLVAAMLSGCSPAGTTADIAATTLPVYQFTSLLCDGTGLTVTRLVTESVSCLHDYSLNVSQVRAVESAKLIITSGAGLEAFMGDLLANRPTADAARGIALLESCDEHGHENHQHQHDPHIWLSPANAMTMAENICGALKDAYPAHAAVFTKNLQALLARLQALLDYGAQQLAGLPARELLTFHDGFAYFAQCFGLTILAAVEEESGGEASAQELIRLITMVREHRLPAVFTEVNGSDAAARVISAETGARVYSLNMAMAGDDYFAAMYYNIDTIREALA